MSKGHSPVVGSVTGTGAAINVILGFIPVYVRLVNFNDAGALDPSLEWYSGQSGQGLLGLRIADSGATGFFSQAKITVGGITTYAGTAGVEGRGFTIGTNVNINFSGEVINYIAFGENT